MLLMGLLCCALTSCEKENHLFNEDQDGLISSQQRYITLTLSDVINYYSLCSPMAKIEYLNFQNEILEFANYKKGFLPAISFNVNPVNFNRSLRLLQSPVDGSYSYVKDFSNTSSVGFTISQKIGLTGGNINIGTDLSFLNEFSTNRKSFSTTPFYVNYSQNLWGGRKLYLLEKRIMNVKNTVSVKKYCSKLAEIQSKAVELYLFALSEKLSADLSEQNMAINDTLLNIGRIKLANGHITKYDYKQIELQSLDTKYAYRQALKKYDEALCELLSYLAIDTDSLSISVPTLDLPMFLDASTIEYFVNRNNPSLLEQQTKKLEAEQNLFTAKMETRFNGSISLNYGLNQYAESFTAAYRNANKRQSISIGFQIPIWQWGINRNKRKIADNNYESSLIAVENSLREFRDDIKEYINTYNHSVCLWELSETSYRLTCDQYAVAVKGFALGELSVYELTSARQKQNETMQQYYSAMKDAYVSYFRLRSMALYDFKLEQNLEDIYLNLKYK